MDQAFRAGDIVACYGRDALSRAISVGTLSLSPRTPRGLRFGPSHVALIVPCEGRLVWAESTTLSDRPCLLRGEPVQGWQVHEIADRLADYQSQRATCDLYRLHPFYDFDVPETLDFERWAVAYWRARAVRYDARNALFSGSRLVRLLRLYKHSDLDAVFCSEYVAAVLRRMHRLATDCNPGRFSPGRLLRELVHAGTYELQRSIGPDAVHAGPALRLYAP